MASSPTGNGTVSTDITYQQAEQFHSTVLSDDGLSSSAWTLYAPGLVLNNMQALWEQIISPDAATSNRGSAELYVAMYSLGNDGSPDAPPDLSDAAIIATNWTNDATLAGLTSVFFGSNACAVGSITLDGPDGEAITTQVGDDSGTNGSYALSSIGSIDYLQGIQFNLLGLATRQANTLRICIISHEILSNVAGQGVAIDQARCQIGITISLLPQLRINTVYNRLKI